MTESDKQKIIRLEQLSVLKDSQETLLSKLSVLMFLVTITDGSSVSMITNEEWKVVCTDNEDKVLFGVKQDGTWEVNADLDEVIDCIIESYVASSSESTDSTT